MRMFVKKENLLESFYIYKIKIKFVKKFDR
jgi:hypothetical protein